MQPAAMLVSKIGNSPWDDFRAVGSSLLSAVVPAECKTGHSTKPAVSFVSSTDEPH
jgi:hypothetical protein